MLWMRRILLTLALAPAARSEAQGLTADAARVMFVNDEWERYARVLQISGDAPLYPWSVRGFGLSEFARLTPTSATHPWSGQPSLVERNFHGVSVTALPVEMQTVFNSRFPFGYNDGPMWAGRGLTTVLQTGATAKAGPFSIVLAPVFFRAQNRPFELSITNLSDRFPFGDAFSPNSIDQPQRFGDRPYERLDPGNSTLRLDLGPAALGVSTAAMHWGPARDHPILLGNNAPGFPHVFVGTSHPVDLKLFSVQARLFWGKEFESHYTRMELEDRYRFATGLAAVIVPRGAPGLEIGGARYFHVLWSHDVINNTNLGQTFGGFLLPNTNPRSSLPDNQLASVFARWALPSSGFEVYGEFGREDHSADLRDLELEPDHSSGYLVGFQRAMKRSQTGRTVLRGEVLDTRISAVVISRSQDRFYVHLPVAQGHTNLGQVLGSVGGFGGGASTLALDNYSPAGRWTISWSRIMRSEVIAFPSGVTDPQGADVQHALSFNGLRFRGRVAITYEVTSVYELNRYFQGDASNLRLASGVRYVW